MSFKKLTALIICVLLLVSTVSGCGSKGKTNEENNDTAKKTEDAEKKTDDEVLMIINGKEITSKEFKYFLTYYKSDLESVKGEITDWSTEISEGYTYKDYVLSGAYEWFRYAAAMRMQAERAGAAMTDEDREELESQWQELCNNYGGEDILLSKLAEEGCSKEIYMYILETAYISDKCFITMFGKDGSKLSDSDCKEQIADDGYYMAKHILLLTTKTSADGKDTEMTDDEKAEVYKKMQGFIEELDNTLPEEVEAKFDELMNEYSEDPGSAAYPGGYLFREGDMVGEFYDTAAALEIGKYSGIVETNYGYHIILRIPIDFDTVPTSYQQYGYTLRYLVADQMFGANVTSCIERLEITKDIDPETFDIEAIFAVG